MHISYKFGLAFGLLLALILFIAITGYVSLQYVSYAEKSIQLSNEIKRLTLEMDRGMEKARWLNGRFFLEYPKTGFQRAHEKYIQPSVKEIQEVIARSSLLKKLLSLSEFDRWENGHMDVTIEKSQIDLNIYLSSAKRFAETALESVTLVSRLAMPEKGLEALLDRHFDLLISDMDRDAYASMNGEREDLSHFCFQMNIMALKYRVSRQRFLMQSAFNVAFALKHAIYNSVSMGEFKREKLLYTIEQWVKVAEEILTVDAAIKGKFNDFTIQANALEPISRTLMQLAEQEVTKARGEIKDAYFVATCIIVLVTVTAICSAIMIFQMLNVSITQRIIALTDKSAKFRQNHLEFSCQRAEIPSQNRGKADEHVEEISTVREELIDEDLKLLNGSGYYSSSPYEYGADELGELARTFDLMAIRMDALLNNLEEKVAQRTSELAESQKRLQRAEKMEAVGVLAGGVAHDLNNILSAVIGYPEILLMSLPSGSDLEKPLKAIRDSGQKAAAVVADLLTLARGAASSRGRENINSLIKQYMDSPEFHKLQESKPSVTYHLQLDPSLHTISCSGIHIRKTIMNLVLNASEAIHSGGSITISTRNQYLDKDLAMQRGVGEGIYVVLNITDSGEGIQEEDIKNIFEPFYTRKVMGKSGTGLGLTVVWNTVQDHSGGITVTSNWSGVRCAVSSSHDGKVHFFKEGAVCTQSFSCSEPFIPDDLNRRGTSFELYFPAIDDETIQGMVEVVDGATGHASSPHLLKGHGEKILVVDDEPDQIDLATRMLTILNYDAAGAESGEKALKYLTQNQVDLLLLDMIMAPGMNGRRTYEQVIRVNPSQKAIIVSGFSESVDVKIALKAGVISYLKKPYSIEELARSVADALKR